jgi:hypothetical protein
MTTLEEKKRKVEEIKAGRLEKLTALELARDEKVLDEEIKLAELETTHGLVGVEIMPVFSSLTGEMVVVHVPDEAQHQQINQKALDGKATVVEYMNYTKSCLVYPSAKAFEALCKRTPDLVGEVSEAIELLAKGRGVEKAKK